MIEKAISRFKTNINASIRKLWLGAGDIFEFFEDMDRAIQMGYNQAWNEGAATCGIQPSERTVQESERLEQLITENRQFIFGFGETIEENSKANGGLLGSQLARGQLWLNKYNEVKSIAQQMACADIKLKWVWSPLKEHCKDCQRLNGRVYRASIWQKWNIHPQSQSLQCNGFRCGCSFVMTDEKVTPGRPPAIG